MSLGDRRDARARGADPVRADGSAGSASGTTCRLRRDALRRLHPPFTLQAVVDGRVVHESRDALRDSLLPATPTRSRPSPLAMDEALVRLRAPTLPATWSRRALGAGAGRPVRRGRRAAQHDEVGRLVVAVVSLEVRDVAWSQMTPRLSARPTWTCGATWSGAPRTRRWPPRPRCWPSPPGCAGDGALAWCAVDRCQEAEPGYSMAAWSPRPSPRRCRRRRGSRSAGALPLFAG